MTRRTNTTIRVVHQREYGFFHLVFDFLMTFLTGGLWLIWILIRFLRTH